MGGHGQLSVVGMIIPSVSTVIVYVCRILIYLYMNTVHKCALNSHTNSSMKSSKIITLKNSWIQRNSVEGFYWAFLCKGSVRGRKAQKVSLTTSIVHIGNKAGRFKRVYFTPCDLSHLHKHLYIWIAKQSEPTPQRGVNHAIHALKAKCLRLKNNFTKINSKSPKLYWSVILWKSVGFHFH